MKKTFIATALCLLLLQFGCRKTETRKAPGVPAAPESATESGALQTPYYAGLIEEYRPIVADDPDNLAAIAALGNAYFGNGQWTEAITRYERALLYRPNYADVRTNLGTAYRNLGMTDRALAEYHTVLEHDPGHLDARYNTGVVYVLKKNYPKAIRIWEDLLKISPNYPAAEQMKSMIMTFKKQLKKDAQ